MYQSCHRCDRARSAISVPSPRHTSSSPWVPLQFPLVRSATLLSLLDFDRPPPHLDFRPRARTTRHFADPFFFSLFARCMTSSPIFIRTRAGLGCFLLQSRPRANFLLTENNGLSRLTGKPSTPATSSAFPTFVLFVA
ncbi:hypothetical protein PGT21_029677 [Puccinia graminis f. sp. tritici]|uniref:Uncharacterized protein n=1 Tax=Puccinia graminis f. sp. tritici TaxID=56615 RepID=A0A5B0M4V5_PUCGR|nr:hypothetical protein PGT21_029677 [Puccinia graminis f. sp. tritici]KAA1135288.1 hypothetical protein PGTUg99_025856 [Puccinia graminis f. sp. tritici]